MNKSEYIALKARIGYELQNLDIIEKALEKEGLFPNSYLTKNLHQFIMQPGFLPALIGFCS